ncbi:CFI-box-CTERM domain-containing protein [Microcoleus vaginatus]|uniref:CFI-box-CTERM domain-containing protein n=1 Tax=Microcoleus vaginatus TaxID=119532 RepID=UPI0032AB0440
MSDIMQVFGINQSVITKTEGKQYQQAGYYDKALIKYNFALDMFRATLADYESSEVPLKDKISLLFLLFDLVEQIKICYGELNEINKHFIFLENSIEIIETLGKYEDKLKVDEFIAYKNISKLIEFSDEQALVLANCRAEFKNASQFIDNSDDPIFRELCSNFDKCCSYSNCLLPSRGVSISSSSSSSSCFIATAAYGTSAHPDIDTFRNFRDKKLLTNPVGLRLVSLYYNISPSIANYVKRQPVIKSFLRQQLERLAEWMRSREVKS